VSGLLLASKAKVPVGPSQWRPPRWVVPLFAVAALVLVPWVVVLVEALPSAHRAAHWDVAWAGFDVGLALLLLAVALAAWRRSPWLEGAATASATLLVVDAWFDILTSSSSAELVVASVEAALVELPLACVCLLLARDTERRFLQPLLDYSQLRRPTPGAIEPHVEEPGSDGQRGGDVHPGVDPPASALVDELELLDGRSCGADAHADDRD
jgi:hypothetical protein